MKIKNEKKNINEIEKTKKISIYQIAGVFGET